MTGAPLKDARRSTFVATLMGLRSNVQCAHCEARLATCVGTYDDPENPIVPACDDCCAHGNEDGWCQPLDVFLENVARHFGPVDGTAVGSHVIEVGSILSQRTKRGAVDLVLNGQKTQFDLDKAREVLGMLSGAIEAAVSDELLFAFLTTKVGLEPEKAGAALLDFRELRQGARSTVFPQ